VTPLMLVPNITSAWLGIDWEYISYIIGFGLYILVYFMQKKRV